MTQPSTREVSYLKIPNPTIEFARATQLIGYAAWSERFTQRSDEDIRKMFAPDEPTLSENANKALERMQSRAQSGIFSGVIALLDREPLGFSWATDDRSISPQQTGLRDGDKSYAWIPHINVLPEAQGHGIGRELLKHVLSPFDTNQKPTAYVFDENRRTLAMFQRIGFVLNPTQPRIKYDYFGVSTHPVEQWRLEAPSVSAVLSALK